MNAPFFHSLPLSVADRRHSELSDLINAAGISDDDATRLNAEQCAIERAMAARRAKSGDEIKAKARVIRRLIVGGNFPDAALPETSDDDIGRMTWSLVSDVLRRDEAAPIDLPIMPLDQMAPLFEALGNIRQVVAAFSCQPRFTASNGLYNEAGGVLDDLSDLIAKAEDRIAALAKSMKIEKADPAYSDDFARRAEILIRREIGDEGMATLVSELYGAAPKPKVRS